MRLSRPSGLMVAAVAVTIVQLMVPVVRSASEASLDPLLLAAAPISLCLATMLVAGAWLMVAKRDADHVPLQKHVFRAWTLWSVVGLQVLITVPYIFVMHGSRWFVAGVGALMLLVSLALAIVASWSVWDLERQRRSRLESLPGAEKVAPKPANEWENSD